VVVFFTFSLVLVASVHREVLGVVVHMFVRWLGASSCFVEEFEGAGEGNERSLDFVRHAHDGGGEVAVEGRDVDVEAGHQDGLVVAVVPVEALAAAEDGDGLPSVFGRVADDAKVGVAALGPDVVVEGTLGQSFVVDFQPRRPRPGDVLRQERRLYRVGGGGGGGVQTVVVVVEAVVVFSSVFLSSFFFDAEAAPEAVVHVLDAVLGEPEPGAVDGSAVGVAVVSEARRVDLVDARVFKETSK